jgi:hypothetical protein
LVAIRSAWFKRTPVSERSVRDDVKEGLAFLVGAILGDVLFGAFDVAGVVASVVGVSVMVVAMSLMRRMSRHLRP